MSIKRSKLKPGDVVYDCHSHNAGNTTLRTWGVWTVRIIEVTDKCIVASWNGNPEREFYGDTLPWSKEKPVLVENFFGTYRKETAAEKKARKASQAPA